MKGDNGLAYHNRVNLWRAIHGKCRGCGAPAMPQKRYCAVHAEKERARAKERRIRDALR